MLLVGVVVVLAQVLPHLQSLLCYVISVLQPMVARGRPCLPVFFSASCPRGHHPFISKVGSFLCIILIAHETSGQRQHQTGCCAAML